MQVPSSSPMQWETQHQSTLEVLIDHITSPPLLAYPDYNAPFIVHTDASQDGLSAVLYQEQNGSTQVIAYASRTLTRNATIICIQAHWNSTLKYDTHQACQTLMLIAFLGYLPTSRTAWVVVQRG